MGESYRKNGEIRTVNKKDIPEKPQGGGGGGGVASTPLCRRGLSVDFFQATHFFLGGKSDQHDQWNVLNLLTYIFSMKDNFVLGGIVPFNYGMFH